MERYQQLMQEQMAAQNGNRPKTATSALSDEDEGEIKLSKSQQRGYERRLINEARKRQAEKYGDEYIEDDED